MPWVPRELYDVMVSALRERAVSSSPVVSGAEPASEAGGVKVGVEGSLRRTAPPRPLPDAVVHAAYQYSYGSKAEAAANLAIAVELWEKDADAATIIRRLRDGAPAPAL